MSFHYEVVFSLHLRDDTPEDVLAELRYHLGLSAEPPARPVIDRGFPVLAAVSATWLPGGEHAVLRRQHRSTRAGVDHHVWALYVRQLWLDDHWAEVWWDVAAWLAPYAEDRGYAGFYREESDDHPTVLLVRDGQAYCCRHGEDPVELTR